MAQLLTLSPTGGGPLERHTHAHNHLFIIVKGEATVILGDEEKIIRENESLLVDGHIPHSVWNNTPETTIMIGLTVK